MPLLDRVTTLIKANLNDLMEKAENPEKLLKQLLLDMQNQFMQLKTQVAMAIADQHLLERKKQENLESQENWLRKAELAVQKNEEELARAAVDRSLAYETAAANFAQQIEDQAHQVQTLRDALHRLEQKITETKAQAELLVAQHRRARLAIQTGAAATALGHGYLLGSGQPTVEQRLLQLEKLDRVDRLLADLKGRLSTG